MTRADDLWVDYPAPIGAGIRLLCVPYAGSGPAVYRHWPAALPGVEVGAIRLPGRDRRINEPPIRRLDQLIPPLVEALVAHFDRPYALFGHSIGARIAFELTRALRRAALPMPLALFASGSRPPHRPRATRLHDLPDDALCDWLVRLGGTSARLLGDADVRATFLPILRADLELEAGAGYRAENPLPCPIRAFSGAADREAPAEHMAEWSRHTAVGFALRIFPGGHFFLRQHYRVVLGDIAAELRTALRPSRAATPSSHDTSGGHLVHTGAPHDRNEPGRHAHHDAR